MKHSRGTPPPASPQEFKERLRIDFSYQCAYCEVTETYRNNLSCFGRDHFRPKSKFKGLEFVYSNLYYCCNDCNVKKGVAWPTPEEEQRGFRFVDPCSETLYGEHVAVQPDGALHSQTSAGSYTCETIRLNRPLCRTFRFRRSNAWDRIQRYQARVQELERVQSEPAAFSAANELLENALREWRDCFQARPLENISPEPR